MKRTLPLILAFTSLAGLASAHHGRDFLLLQDPHVPSAGHGDLFAGVTWSQSYGEGGFEAESGLLLGLGRRLGLGVLTQFSDDRGGWDFSSVAPYVHVDLTPSRFRWPVHMGIVAAYEFAQEPETRRQVILVPVQQPATQQIVVRTVVPPADSGGGDEDPGPCGPDYGPDAPPCPEKKAPAAARRSHRRHAGHSGSPVVSVVSVTPSRSASSGGGAYVTEKRTVTLPPDSQTGVHRHGENHLQARFILEVDVTESDKFLANLINVTPESGKPAWGYGVGVRHEFSHSIAVGIEATGDFGDSNDHELLLGTYLSPSHSFSCKFGVGIGLTKDSPDVSLQTGLVWRF